MIRTIYIIILLILGQSLYAQLPAQSVLVDEFGPYPCDGLRGRIDIFLVELQQNPAWDGVIVNIGREKEEIWAVLREEMIRSHVTFRGFDASRIRYSRQPAEEFKTQFFRVSSSQPKQSDISKNYVLTSVTTPVELKDYDFDDLCPGLNYLELFGTLLEQNQNATGTILVRGRTFVSAGEKKRKGNLQLSCKDPKNRSGPVKTISNRKTGLRIRHGSGRGI